MPTNKVNKVGLFSPQNQIKKVGLLAACERSGGGRFPYQREARTLNTGVHVDINIAKQLTVCKQFGAEFLASPDSFKIGISRDFDGTRFPINGLRHPPEAGTTGWYLWTEERFSDAPDFFVPLHIMHLASRCPEIIKYLGLAPGWRFLFAPDYEDVWFDKALLHSP